jgi:farnesyl-diphosphate farnesyltransferase
MTDQQLQNLLRPVARSFSVNLRLLPAEMRRPLSLGYLLARLSDSVADSPGPATPERTQLLLALRDNPGAVERDAPGFPLTASPGEKKLWESWSDLKLELERSKWKPEISKVWGCILDGQLFDLQRTMDNAQAEPLSWGRLLDYCDSVAGSVGLFWHEVGEKIWPDWTSLPAQTAKELARSYGCGLQLLNICRDAASDAQSGRVYLAGPDSSYAFDWMRSALQGGTLYARSLRSWRLRWATSLPAALGQSLLPALESGQPSPKLSRRAVRVCLLRSFWQSRTRVQPGGEDPVCANAGRSQR